jgi:hypothetical protein
MDTDKHGYILEDSLVEIEITDRKLIEFINDQIAQGNFATPEEVVLFALQFWLDMEIPLSDEDVQAVKISDEQFARGEGIPNSEAKRRIRKLYKTGK